MKLKTIIVNLAKWIIKKYDTPYFDFKPIKDNTKIPIRVQCSFKYTSGDLEERAKCISDIKSHISNTISNNIKFEDNLFDDDFISGKKTIVGTICIYTDL